MTAALFSAALAVALLATAGPAAAAGTGALDRLVGTWDSPGTFADSAYSKAGSARGTTTCEWSDDRLFLICQQTVSMGGAISHDLAIYTFDAATKNYRFYSITASSANVVKLSIDGNTMTYSDAFVDGSKHVETRTLNVWDGPASYSWRVEYSIDGGAHWILMGSGKATRTT